MNKIKARKRIRTHLRKKGQYDDFEITPHFVLFWWHALNRAVFNGELEPPKNVEIRNFHDGALGWCKSTGKKTPKQIIGIRRDLDDRKIFLTILVHEMVHQWEHQTLGIMTHEKSFYDWDKKIRHAIGLPLQEYVDVNQ